MLCSPRFPGSATDTARQNVLGTAGNHPLFPRASRVGAGTISGPLPRRRAEQYGWHVDEAGAGRRAIRTGGQAARPRARPGSARRAGVEGARGWSTDTLTPFTGFCRARLRVVPCRPVVPPHAGYRRARGRERMA